MEVSANASFGQALTYLVDNKTRNTVSKSDEVFLREADAAADRWKHVGTGAVQGNERDKGEDKGSGKTQQKRRGAKTRVRVDVYLKDDDGKKQRSLLQWFGAPANEVHELAPVTTAS
ncbi:hypothetical protein HDV00_011828 [Rhizophlyctis rosea]|nr:hypothetical protein HDV00_011828 [Rhizophlyctis rosea]